MGVHQLSHHEIKVAEDIFEPAAKEYTTMVIDIINKRMWNGAIGKSDVMVVDKDRAQASTKPRGRLKGPVSGLV